MNADAIANDNVVYKIGGFSVSQAIVRHIRDASEISGVNFDYMIAKAGHESRFDAKAAAERSSAEGLYQFTVETWLQQMKQHGAKYGYASLASKIYRDSRGRYRVTDSATRKRILDLRRSPRIAAFLAAEYAKSNKRILQDQVRGEITSADLYIAHFMGPSGAVILLRADKFTPDKLAADLFPDAAEANPPIFFTKDKKMRTVREVRRELTDIFQDKIRRFAKLPKSLKSWLEKNPAPKEFAQKKSNVVVNAPQLRMQATLDEKSAAPVPKIADNMNFSKILPGEGVNLDDEDVMAKYMSVAKLSEHSGKSDIVSADLSPVSKVSYDVAGVAEIESASGRRIKISYSAAAATKVETADVFVQTLPAYTASVETRFQKL